MKRKLNMIGGWSLFITLPAEWCKNNKLKNGDEVEVNIKNNKVVVENET